MPGDGPHNPLLRDKLAAWVASGRSIAAFGKQHEIPIRTCYSWSGTPEFKAKVRRIRQRMLDRVAGTLIRHGLGAVDQIARLSRQGDSDTVKLGAAKVLLDQMIHISDHADWERRLAALETNAARPTGGSDTDTHADP